MSALLNASNASSLNASLKTRNGFWRQFWLLDQSDVIFLFLHADKRTPTRWTNMIKHFFLQTLYSGKIKRFIKAKSLGHFLL